MNFSNEDYAEIADMLISYHAHAFRIRRVEIFDFELPVPVIHELDNARRRLRNDYTDEEKLTQAFGFHEIISRGRDTVAQLSEEAKKANDSREHYRMARETMNLMSAADYLLELLDAR